MRQIKCHKSIQFTEMAKQSYKIGVDEVAGLMDELKRVMSPIRDALNEKAYWAEIDFDSLEYKSRDGFIPYSHNCGGVELGLQVPECESLDWGFLEFGELTEEYLRDDEPWENEGELDAYLRIILKFEGFDDAGNMQFYLNVSGGNNDAPYFRTAEMPDLFEAEFTCKKIEHIKMKARPYIRKILKMINE